MIGYVTFNTALVFGFFKPVQLGVFGCLVSLGSIGCPDTINGLVYSLLGGFLAGTLVYFAFKNVVKG